MAKEGAEKTPRHSPLRRWAVRLLVLLVVAAALIWFAPWIVATTALRHRLISFIAPELSGNVASAQLSWLSPVELGGVSLNDGDGQPLLDLERAACDRTLFQLVSNPGNATTVKIEQPRLHCVVRNDGSNIEDALQSMLADQDSGSTAIPLTIELLDGVIEIADANGTTAGSIEEVDLTCRYRPNADSPLEISATGRVSDAKTKTKGSPIKAELRLVGGTTGAASVLQSSLSCKQVPLAGVEPLLRRFLPAARLQGELSCDARLDWDTAAEQTSANLAGTVGVNHLIAGAPALLGNDKLEFAQLTAGAQLSIAGDHLEVREGKIATEVGQLELNGAMNIRDLSAGRLAAIFGNRDYHVAGRIDVAKLSEKLPQLLRIKDGTRINSGEITLALDSTVGDGARRRWSGQLTTTSLQGTAAGRQITWPRPVQVSFDVGTKSDGALDGRLTCESEFLQAAAFGSLDACTWSAEGDLDRLVADLQQFVDLGDVQLAGKFKSGGELWRVESGHFDGNLLILLTDLVLALPDRKPIREPRMTVNVDAAGTSEGVRLSRVETAQLRVASGADRLTVALTDAVEQPTQTGQWPLAIELKGELATWLPRLQSLVSLDGWDIRGGINCTGKLVAATEGFALGDAKVNFTDLSINGHGLAISEPAMELTGSGSWNEAQRSFRSDGATIASATLAARGENLIANLQQHDKTQISGTIAVRGDLARLQTWIAEWPEDLRMAGQLNGQVALSTAEGVVRGEGNVAVADLVVSTPAADVRSETIRPVGQSRRWSPVWQEKQATLSGRSEYIAAEDRLNLSALSLQTNLATLQQTSGAITQLTTNPTADLRGTLQYDLAAMNGLLQAYAGQNVRAEGRGARPFAFRGPLAAVVVSADGTETSWWQVANASAVVGWDSIVAYGLTAGAGQLAGTMSDGRMQFDPLDVAFTQGRLQTTPQLHFAPAGALLTLSENSRIDRARITPELCQSWFQFVAPLLANATRAEGLFSIQSQRAEIPISAASQSTIAGNLTIHAARISPGPGTQQIVSIAQQVDAILRRRPANQSSAQLDIAEQIVPFEVKDGRVHHRDFHIEVGDVEVRSHGSVGMDTTLALVAEIPIRDAWVERDPKLRALRGQTLEIPIRGTLSKPKVDNRILKDLAKMVAAGAAGNLIDDAINGGLEKGLDGLFKRLQP